MDRADFLRKLQKGQHDREYRHVATQGPPPLSADKDLQEKIAALNAEIAESEGTTACTVSEELCSKLRR
jgi:hypothetical protein